MSPLISKLRVDRQRRAAFRKARSLAMSTELVQQLEIAELTGVLGRVQLNEVLD
jgi:hypothetical protein